MAAAIGAGLPVAEPQGSMVVDIGGGTSEVAVISLGGIVSARSVRVGGDKFDDAIVQYIKKKYYLLIGERTAEEIKIKIGSAFPYEGEAPITIKGRNLADGLPKNIDVYPEEIREALADPLSSVVDAIKGTLEKDTAGAVGGYHRQRHRPHRRRRAAARPGQAGGERDRHLGARGGQPAGLRRPGHRHRAGQPGHPAGGSSTTRTAACKASGSTEDEAKHYFGKAK